MSTVRKRMENGNMTSVGGMPGSIFSHGTYPDLRLYERNALTI